MNNLVLATFPAQTGKLEELKNLFREALVDTRAFDGCISIEVYVEKDTETVHLVEDWESLEHYGKYLQWRLDTGLPALLDPILEGGASGLKVMRCGVREDI